MKATMTGAAAATALFLVLALPAGGPLHAEDVYRWVDKAGKVHYGNQVPDADKANARKMDSGVEPTPTQRQDAQQRATREKNRYRSTARKPLPPPPMSVAAAPPRTGDAACAEQWRKFSESGACFAPYRVVGGGLKPEAYQNCVEVAEPTCGPYPDTSSTRR